VSIAKTNRAKSYEKTKPHFNNGEMAVLRFINMGYKDAWSIHKQSGMLLTSVRRALTDMHQRGHLVETNTVFNAETGRSVTSYSIASKTE